VRGVVVRPSVKACARISWWLRGGAALVLAVLVASVFGRPGCAETLEQALADAYLINPALNSERARLRATDEQVAIAKSGLRPNISWDADTNYVHQEAGPDFSPKGGSSASTSGAGGPLNGDGTSHPHGYTFSLIQPLFEGFQNLNAVRQAKSIVRAGRESLRTIEQTVLLDAVTAYVNVVRDVATVRLRENNVKVLTEQLKETKDRFVVGEVTRTDVAQAEARRADALATLAVAQASLKQSNAAYEQIIGHPPGNLVTPPSIKHLLPTTLDAAMTLGDGENPIILAAVYQEEASLYVVQQIMGQLLPTVTLGASFDDQFPASSMNSFDEIQTTTVVGRLHVPLYQGGGPSAEVRQAKETNNQLKKEVEDARLRVHADVVSQWGLLQSTGSEIASAQASVSANKVALTGVQEEFKVGQRTTLDVLNAQLELVTSQIGLVTALRDRVVAEYSLYAAIGRMDAQTLGLPVPYYDPIEHYDIVKNKWFGLRPPAPPASDE
jgi:outer membrane protein